MLDGSRYWYRASLHPLMFCLLPFSGLFYVIVAIRRWLYRVGLLKSYGFSVPVIIVGNVTVGGTGKTPFVIWLAKYLQAQGYRPGIVSRGVGGIKHHQPHRVKVDDKASVVGDEALLLARNSECPLVIGVDRAAAVRALLMQTPCDIIISDDGLQHYALRRDIEIAVLDGKRLWGNGYVLPAGPLRESHTRSVDFTVINGEEADATFTLQPNELISLSQMQSLPLAQFAHTKIHAVAGIGHPQRFFDLLKRAGFDMIPHIFPDHYAYQAQDFQFADTLPIIMTEKDAVKCTAFADERFWFLTVTLKIRDDFTQRLLKKITSLEMRHDSEADFSQSSCRALHNEQRDSFKQ